MKRDQREYAKQTNIRLGVGAALLLFIIGTALIWFIYGFGAAMMGLLCLVAALVPVALIFFSLQLLDWINKRANRE